MRRDVLDKGLAEMPERILDSLMNFYRKGIGDKLLSLKLD